MLNPFSQARFLLSCATLPQLPDDSTPELAFVGRSNAGKSSALNALCGKNALARVSKTPGRTQLINFFELPGLNARLVDLPGYGFAAVPESVRRNWGVLIGGYVESRTNLVGVVVIMDIRHPLTELDQQMLSWAKVAQRPAHVLLTKSDKLGFGAAKSQLQAVQRSLGEIAPGATVQLFSAHAKAGVEEGRQRMAELLGLDGDAASPEADTPQGA